jgi:glycerophosphoryl diester phosphodiesterase
MNPAFNLQGHRGARGLRPENTLPAFETAIDLGVTSIETDLHLTRDGEVVLCHDPTLSPLLFTPLRKAAPLSGDVAIRDLTLDELRGYRAAGNPDPGRFPVQDASVTPLAQLFARKRGFDPHAVPTLADLFRFVSAYAGEEGIQAGKTPAQRQWARQLRFDLELKRVPFFPESINDGYTGHAAGPLEESLVAAVHAAGVVDRVTVRSFDHRCIGFLRRLEPCLTGAVLVAGNAPVAPAELVRRADAQIYCPCYLFVDEEQIEQVHEAGYQVLPWTVNEPDHWERLLRWRVDGITTDFPDRLLLWLETTRGGSSKEPPQG